MNLILEKFKAAAADPAAIAASIQKEKKIIGHMCSYTPEEIIHAAGFHPFRMFSSKPDIIQAESHLQAYCCSLVRGVLEDSLAGRLDFLEGAVFPHTCDSIQRLSDIWRMKKRTPFFCDVMVPSKLNTQSAENYMVEVLERFKKQISAAAGKEITDQDLEASIQLSNKIRDLLSSIYDYNRKNPGTLESCDLYALVKGAMVMDRNTAADLLTKFLDDLKVIQPADKKLKPVVITGTICDSPAVFNAINDAGGIIVSDDLCTGRRWFEGKIETGTGNPVAAIAERYLQRVACPAKHSGIHARGEEILSQVKKTNASGVIFVRLKFCDPHAFDYPYIKSVLDKEGIRMLLVEMDDLQGNQGQLATRIETFIHII